MPFTQSEKDAIVATHNKYRDETGIKTPALTWDDTLVAGAQTWADSLAQGTPWGHSPQAQDPNGTLGENIAKTTGKAVATDLVNSWGGEKKNFTPGLMPRVQITPGTTEDKVVGHYTQVIWNDTTKVGCGMASDGTTTYLVCRYSPKGNIGGTQVPKPLPLPFKNGDVISLQADTNLYWGRVNRGSGRDPIEPTKPTVDQFSQFTVSVLGGNSIALTADTGLYLSHVTRNGREAIEAAKSTFDNSCEFEVMVHPNGQITLMANDNQLYLSRINLAGESNPYNVIEAIKPTIDQFSRFTVGIVSPAP